MSDDVQHLRQIAAQLATADTANAATRRAVRDPRQLGCGGSVWIHSQTSSTWRSSVARSPELSITRSAISTRSLPRDLVRHPGPTLLLRHRPTGDDPFDCDLRSDVDDDEAAIA